MRLIRSTCLATLLVAPALLLAASAARADGDPASDYLYGDTNAFFPFQEMVSPNVADAVRTTVARAKAAGFPIKVAIISAATDLGSVPDLFGKPQQFSDFLDKEISFNRPAMLLVVMPQGFGVTHAGSAAALAAQRVPPGTGGDRLARAAMPAVAALAAQAGHPITLPAVKAAGGSGGGGSSALLTFGAPLALILLVGGLALMRGGRGRADDDELDDDAEDEPERGEDAAEPEPEPEPGEPGAREPGAREPGAPEPDGSKGGR
ncbi:MAG: hypothetical protein ACR2KV_06715 [Solirubrobacteraceae bacterium]